MIGTFWNLCRACPSVPVDKLHSEYRSTYRWHELAGQRQEIIRRAPQTASSIGSGACEPALPRRRKHPELAYRAHDFLVSLDGGTEHLLEKAVVYDRARSEERWSHTRQKTSRRSKSEGPPNSQPSYRLLHSKVRDEVDGVDDKADVGQKMSQSLDEKSGATAGSSEYKLQFAWPPVSAVLSSGLANICAPRKSISMSGIKSKGHIEDAVPVHRRNLAAKVGVHKEILLINGLGAGADGPNIADMSTANESIKKPFSSEYKKQFQPFYNYNYDENRGTWDEKKVLAVNGFSDTVIPPPPSAADSVNSNWYREVVLLRKKAHQYRHRGWGTELVPDHIAQLYNDQLSVWEQVSRRSTLSALSLATTTITKSPRSTSKEDKEREARKGSPSKLSSRSRSARTETDSAAVPPSEKNRSRPTKSDATSAKGNARMKPKSLDRSSPKHRRSTSRSRASANPTEGQETNQASTRRPRPSEPCNDTESEFPTVPDEQLVKSPPEPTRVKSPEQIVLRSPEPVNWTVPLDTGKTFTVTQNIRDGELLPRSLSEARAWTPAALLGPSAASVSAPPQLVEPPVAVVR